MKRLPIDKDDNYSQGIIAKRQEFVRGLAPHSEIRHIFQASGEPGGLRGNIENYVGVAQVPIGLAGPLKVNGEYADGEFYIPMATTEGALVASYNRGMKVLTQSGGVMTTIMEDAMQRAPVFIFDNARLSRNFMAWVDEHLQAIKQVAESTTRVGRLLSIEKYTSNNLVFLRFNYSTGDAAGQNMVSKATYAACQWIAAHATEVRRWFLESNFATDKKASRINMLMTRGKRVTAEVVVPRRILAEGLRVAPESIQYHYKVSSVAGFLSGINNNGLHSANGLAAMFIATGQDAANIAESSAGILYTEMTKDKNLYFSLTIPSLIVATYGGGTALPTQRECLELMDCYGQGKVQKLAEIMAAVSLAGEISLAASISAQDWVSSHERLGRNR